MYGVTKHDALVAARPRGMVRVAIRQMPEGGVLAQELGGFPSYCNPIPVQHKRHTRGHQYALSEVRIRNSTQLRMAHRNLFTRHDNTSQRIRITSRRPSSGRAFLWVL